MQYEVIGTTKVGTYAVTIKADNKKTAIRKAIPKLKEIIFGNYPIKSIRTIKEE